MKRVFLILSIFMAGLALSEKQSVQPAPGILFGIPIQQEQGADIFAISRWLLLISMFLFLYLYGYTEEKKRRFLTQIRYGSRKSWWWNVRKKCWFLCSLLGLLMEGIFFFFRGRGYVGLTEVFYLLVHTEFLCTAAILLTGFRMELITAIGAVLVTEGVGIFLSEELWNCDWMFWYWGMNNRSSSLMVLLQIVLINVGLWLFQKRESGEA